MAVMAREPESNFTPAPPGLHLSVCVDVVDLGMVEGVFGTKHMVRLVWQTEERMDSGDPFVVSKRYTLSLHEKANLRKDLENWRNRRFTADELKGFDLEKLIGVPCQLQVMHNERDGKTYTNVTAIMTAPKGTDLKPLNFTRAKDRDDYQPPSEPEEDSGHLIEGDEDLPF